jgi:hypothetical protein
LRFFGPDERVSKWGNKTAAALLHTEVECKRTVVKTDAERWRRERDSSMEYAQRERLSRAAAGDVSVQSLEIFAHWKKY